MAVENGDWPRRSGLLHIDLDRDGRDGKVTAYIRYHGRSGVLARSWSPGASWGITESQADDLEAWLVIVLRDWMLVYGIQQELKHSYDD